MTELLDKLGLPYKDQSLYETALTHSSYAYENHTEKNERLEFLGDAVLGLLMTDYLYREALTDEGVMSKKKAKAVSEGALVLYADMIGLKEHLRLGKGEALKGANDAMIADAFEALLGAIYLDLGFAWVKRVFQAVIVPNLAHALEIRDYKSTLQEYIHSGDKRNISYHLVHESGPSHDKIFEVVVKLDRTITLGHGIGRTKKEAEQRAARDALAKGNYDSKDAL
ncbi:MAG: ribonuclease III [Acholeplasmataceae bacterium]